MFHFLKIDLFTKNLNKKNMLENKNNGNMQTIARVTVDMCDTVLLFKQ